MSDKIITRVAELMREQTVTYGRLDSVCERLSAALFLGDVEQIEFLTKLGERELVNLGSCLDQISSALCLFGTDGSGAACRPVSQEAQAAFESASAELMSCVGDFQRWSSRIAELSIGGAEFAMASIDMCNAQPMTFNARHIGAADTIAQEYQLHPF